MCSGGGGGDCSACIKEVVSAGGLVCGPGSAGQHTMWER